MIRKSHLAALALLLLCVAVPLHAENSVQLGCPISFGVPSQDTVVRIPVYFSNDDSLGAIILGFTNSSNVARVVDFDTTGTVVTVPFRLTGTFEYQNFMIRYPTYHPAEHIPPTTGWSAADVTDGSTGRPLGGSD